MDETVYFQNHVSKKDKAKIMRAMVGCGMLRQDEIHDALVKAALPTRIADSKAACSERRKRREEREQRVQI